MGRSHVHVPDANLASPQVPLETDGFPTSGGPRPGTVAKLEHLSASGSAQNVLGASKRNTYGACPLSPRRGIIILRILLAPELCAALSAAGASVWGARDAIWSAAARHSACAQSATPAKLTSHPTSPPHVPGNSRDNLKEAQRSCKMACVEAGTLALPLVQVLLYDDALRRVHACSQSLYTSRNIAARGQLARVSISGSCVSL